MTRSRARSTRSPSAAILLAPSAVTTRRSPSTSTTPNFVVIPAEVRRELERHALEEAPNEACGLVVLREGHAVRYERGRNADASPYRFRLEVEPEIWFL